MERPAAVAGLYQHQRPGDEFDDSSKAVDVPNVQKLEVLDGYFAWRLAKRKEPLSAEADS